MFSVHKKIPSEDSEGIFFNYKTKIYFLFKAALISIEIAERSILSFPAIVSITTVVSATSATLP